MICMIWKIIKSHKLILFHFLPIHVCGERDAQLEEVGSEPDGSAQKRTI